MLLIAAMVGLALPATATSASVDADASVQSGRTALGNHWSYPWYDESTDGIRVLEFEPPKEAPEKEASPSERSSTPSSGVTEVVVITVGAVVLGAMAFFLARAFLKAEQATAITQPGPSREIDITRIEHLPVRIADGKTDLLAEARRLSTEQRYGEAMVYLYSHQLLELDRLHVIRLTRGKTNRQYLREAARAAGVKDTLATSIVAFEDVFFGHHELSRERFETCLAGVEQLSAAAQRGSA
ncbi:MAG TPA: DUF4129 domain-containing protein [Pirellulales bacterium]|jgi:hypothetical protein|nr:DUF4129 domain-containing protein [Pirellulales bacterium]